MKTGPRSYGSQIRICILCKFHYRVELLGFESVLRCLSPNTIITLPVYGASGPQKK